jgi:hypothetical protein
VTRRTTVGFGLALAFVSVLGAACSTILGLEAPPASSRDGGPSDATIAAENGAGADGSVDVATDAGLDGPDTALVMCQPLDAGDGATTYFPMTQAVVDEAGTYAWSFFDTTPLGSASFAGGTFDGTYLYFAGRGNGILRLDPGGSFEDKGSWAYFSPLPSTTPAGFNGAVYDGTRYVYFVPSSLGGPGTTAPTSVVVRYDTAGAGFKVPSSWAAFDMSTLSADGGPVTAGFLGGGFDGRYVYFVPHNDGVPDGRVVRFDTTVEDAGGPDAAAPEAGAEGGVGATDSGSDGAPDGGEDGAGEAGRAPEGGIEAGGSWAFEPQLWTTFNAATLDPAAVGFAGAVFDGTALYFVPNVNDVYDAEVSGGTSGTVVRLLTADGGFVDAASWSTFDVTKINGLATNFYGGAFADGHLYLAPRGEGIATRFDTSSTQLNTASAWETYDTTRATTAPDGSIAQFAGAAYDGRFVYYVPGRTGLSFVLRYDTWSTFGADCAWSAIDLGQLDAGSITFYIGAVFDGQYVYLIPDGSRLFARFRARTPGPLPDLPFFHGSFL